MNEKQYSYRTAFTFKDGSTGYVGEETGILSGDSNWHTTSSKTGSANNQYFYRDSNQTPLATNDNSSRVVLDISNTWEVSFMANNVLGVKATTIINSIRRDDIRGNPVWGRSDLRNIYIYQFKGGPLIASFLNLNIGVAQTIASNVNLGTYTIVLPPGKNYEASSVYVLSTVPGHENDPLPNIFTDAMGLGAEFRNILPADYRPGQTYNDGKWLSHDRANGKAQIYNGGWQEMRTVDYPTGQGNPPLLYRDNAYYNMAKIGEE